MRIEQAFRMASLLAVGPRLEKLSGAPTRVVRLELLGVQQVELLSEDQAPEAVLALLDLLLLVSKSLLRRQG